MIESIPAQHPGEHERLLAVKKLILSGEQYATSAFVESGNLIHQYRIEAGDKVVYFFGSPHVNDVGNGVFNEITEAFEEVQPQRIMVEGMHALHNRERVLDHLEHMTREEAQALGEPMYTLKLGAEHVALGEDVDFESPEPKLSDELNYLEDLGFEREDIFKYYYYRDIDQYFRTHIQRTHESLVEYLAPYIEHFKTDSGWDEMECARYLDNMDANINLTENRYASLVDPIPWPDKNWTLTNDIASKSSRFRDEYILERITKALERQDRIFVVYGSGHAVVLEPALRALMENLQS